MRRLTLALILAATTAARASDEPVSLFDGRTLDGWTVRGGSATFRVEDGCIVGRTAEASPNTFLCKGDYADFELEFEVKLDPRLNSGVQVRSRVFDKDTPRPLALRLISPDGTVYGPQCEIARREIRKAGNFWDEARRLRWLDPDFGRENPEVFEAFRDDDWNHYRIVVRGDRYRSWVNGIPCADFTDDLDTRGFIGLQVHAISKGEGPYEVRWQNLRLRELRPGDPED